MDDQVALAGAMDGWGGLIMQVSGAVYPFCGQEGGFFSTNGFACIAKNLQNNQALSGTYYYDDNNCSVGCHFRN